MKVIYAEKPINSHNFLNIKYVQEVFIQHIQYRNKLEMGKFNPDHKERTKIKAFEIRLSLLASKVWNPQEVT